MYINHDCKTPADYARFLTTENKIQAFLNEFNNQIYNQNGNELFVTINKEKGILKYTFSAYDATNDFSVNEEEILEFNKTFDQDLKSNLDLMIYFFRTKFEDFISNGQDPKTYTNYQIGILRDCYNKSIPLYRENPFNKEFFENENEQVIHGLKYLIHEIEQLIKMFSTDHISSVSTESVISNIQSPNSFLWDFVDEKEASPILTNLYLLLSESPALIQCDKEDFINAFTKKEVPNGIRWMVKAKNKQYSKASLFYFINLLNEGGYLVEVPTNDINAKIKYVFRDGDGNELKNIRQSKANTSKSPAEKERIDSIISRLH